MDDDLELIRSAVRTLCERFADDYWSACDQEHRFPWDFYRAMAEGGWIGIAIPERYGGGGHPRVGAISLPKDALAHAREVAAEVAAELRS